MKEISVLPRIAGKADPPACGLRPAPLANRFPKFSKGHPAAPLQTVSYLRSLEWLIDTTQSIDERWSAEVEGEHL